MFDPELEKAVEKLCKSDAPVTMTKSDQYLQLKRFSNRQRLPTESVEKAFTRFITTDPDGKQLYRTYTQTRGVSVPVAKTATGHNAGAEGDPKRQTGNDGDGETEHMRTLREIASKIQIAHPELRLTKSSAITLAISTIPAAREAYLADRRARTGVA